MATQNLATAATPNAAPAAPAKAAKEPRYVAITLFPELTAALNKARGDKSLGTFARDIICEKLNVTKPATIRGKKSQYSDPAERAAAKKAAAKTRAEMVKKLLEANADALKKALEEAEKAAIAELHSKAAAETPAAAA